jgi:hypothetical protein
MQKLDSSTREQIDWMIKNKKNKHKVDEKKFASNEWMQI